MEVKRKWQSRLVLWLKSPTARVRLTHSPFAFAHSPFATARVRLTHSPKSPTARVRLTHSPHSPTHSPFAIRPTHSPGVKGQALASGLGFECTVRGLPPDSFAPSPPSLSLTG